MIPLPSIFHFVSMASHLTGAARFGVGLRGFPRVARAGEALMAIPGFAAAHPDPQADAPRA